MSGKWRNGDPRKMYSKNPERDKKIVEMHLDGIGTKKIARELHCGRDTVEKALFLHGITYLSSRAKARISDEEIQNRLGDAWIYVGGYKRFDSMITVRCPICGRERTGRLADIKSPCSCVKEKTKQKAEIQKILDFWDEMQKPKPLKKDIVISRCKICNKPFVKDNGHSAYCSEDCARKGRRIKEAKKNDVRLRRMKESEMDDISLGELYERDNGVCWICGEVCDLDDCFWADGTFFAGGSYPSIDHVIPIAKGGTHKWENVRLAHRICNSLKRDK